MFSPETALEEIANTLAHFDRAATIAWCARLNALDQSDLTKNGQQDALTRTMFSDDPDSALEALGGKRSDPDRWEYGLNRQPLLELIRWATVLDEGTRTPVTPESRRAIVSAAQKAGQLAIYRTFAAHGEDFPENPTRSEELRLGLTLFRVMGQFQKRTAGADLLAARTRMMMRGFFDTGWQAAFQRATGLDPEDYAAGTLFILDLAGNRDATGMPSIRISREDIVARLGRVPSRLETFLDWISRDLADLRIELLRKVHTEGQPIPPLLPFDSTPLRAKPLVRLPDGSRLLVDREFLEDKLWLSMFDMIGVEHNAARVLGHFGKSIEKYVARLLESIAARGSVKQTCQVLRNPMESDGREIADIAMRCGQALVLFEVKSSWINEASLREGTRDYHDTLIAKFANPGAQRQGVTQLANSIRRLARGEARPKQAALFSARKVYPVLVVQDEQLTQFRHEEALAGWFREHLAPDAELRWGEPFFETRRDCASAVR